MNKDDIFTTLPKKAEMLTSLLSVSKNEHLREQFYPLLLENAGQRRVPHGMVNMLLCAAYDYTKGMPKNHKDMMLGLLCPLMPKFIDVLSPNKRFAAKAQKLFQEGRNSCKGGSRAQDTVGKSAEKS